MGSTVICWGFACRLFVSHFPLCLGPLRFGGGSVPIYTCARREGVALLLLILAGSPPWVHGEAR